MGHDSELQERWQRLVEAVIGEAERHRQFLDRDAGGTMKVSDTELKISLVMADGHTYYPKTFVPEDILQGDIPKLAREFYDAYRDADE